ncbi:PGF-CTERM sorting domain-containing protein [Haladaptatus halobius]|nr:PGF-CTERM sorting domain-containing protein [Haladaptatus halobius]
MGLTTANQNGQPGFGLSAGLAALAGIILLARRA